MELFLALVAIALSIAALIQSSELRSRVSDVEWRLGRLQKPAEPTAFTEGSRCEYCHAPLLASDVFCSECGGKVTEKSFVPPGTRKGRPISQPEATSPVMAATPTPAASRVPTKPASEKPAASSAPLKTAGEKPAASIAPAKTAAKKAAVPAPVVPAPPRQPILKPVMQRVRTTEEWEALIGGRWLNRLGAVALVLGLAFFFKYAMDNNWISPSFRVAVGLAVGTGLLAGAWRTNKRGLAIFAQGLVGAGLATLYLSVYAAANFYDLIPQSVALTGLAIVVGVAFVHALWYDSLAVALLAWAGGFAAIPLLGVTSGNEVGVMAYVALLDAGMLAIVARRDRWVILEPLAMGATYVTFFGWYAASYKTSMLVLATIGITLFWAVFYAIEVWRIVTHRYSDAALHHALGVVNVELYYTGVAVLLRGDRVAWGVITLALSAVYIGTILLARRRLRSGDAIDGRFTLTAIVLAVIATPILASGFLLPILWTLEALALLAMGIRWKLGYVWQPAIALYGLASSALLLTPGALAYTPLEHFNPIVNVRALAFLVLAVSFAAGARLLQRLATKRADTLVSTFQYAWLATVFLLLTLETIDFFGRQLLSAHGVDRLVLEQQRSLALSILWSLEGLALLASGIRWKLPYVWWPSTGLYTLAAATLLGVPRVVSNTLGTTGGALTYQPLEDFVPIVNGRTLAFLVLAASLTGSVRLLRGFDRKQVGTLLVAFQYAWQATIFLLLTVETVDIYGRQLLSAHGLDPLALEQQRSLALAVVWMLYALLLVHEGLRRRIFPVLSTGMAVTALSVGLGAGTGLAFQPIERFVPILNDRAMVMILLIAGLVWQQDWLRARRTELPWIDTAITTYRTVIVLLGFELVTVEIHDYFRHAAGAISESAGPSGTFIEIVMLSAVWMLYSFPLVRYGIRSRSLAILLTGLGSLAASTGAAATAAAVYQPATWLSTALTFRSFILIFIAVGLLLQMRWLREGQRIFAWLDGVVLLLQASVVLLGFELISAHTRDVYDVRVAEASSNSAVDTLRNMEQLTLSVLWLVYAIGLLIVGFWRRLRWLRVGALALMGFALVKITLYDLSFLSGGYRSLSFVGLGVVLLAASYLYQRYHTLILASDHPTRATGDSHPLGGKEWHAVTPVGREEQETTSPREESVLEDRKPVGATKQRE